MNTKEFMTKTKLIRRNDENPKGFYLIAMDIGYSAVKVMSANIAGMFPSYAMPDNQMGTAGTLSDDYIRYTNLDSGEKWFVGKMALDLLSDDDTDVSESTLYRRDRYDDPVFKVIMETGLGLACLYDKEGIHKTSRIVVETGLPPRYITKSSYDASVLTALLSCRHHFSLQFGQKEPVEFDITIATNAVHIMPQPMGTLFSVAVDNNHKMLPHAKTYFNKNVLIFDGGFGTLDLYPIKSHVIQQSETYGNLGMKRVLEEASNVIRNDFGKDISVAAMQKYLESGTFRCFDKKNISTKDEPLDGIIESCSKKICEEALNKTLQVYPLYEYDYLIVTGGTGAAWFDYITEKLKGMTTLTVISGAQNDNLPGVFSNVRGYYMFRYSDIK